MKKLEEMTLADDFMFCKVMENEAIAKEFIEELLGNKVATITCLRIQESYKDNSTGHGVRFDVRFIGDDIIYNIEMQQSMLDRKSDQDEQRNLFRRTRYYHANLATQALPEGEDYGALPDSYVIFVCKFDPFGKGYAKYDIKPYNETLGCVYPSGERTILLNAYFTDKNVSSGIKDFLGLVRDGEYECDSPTLLFYKVVEEIKKVRQDPKVRREFMSYYEHVRLERAAARAEGREEGRAEGRAEGREEGIEETILKFALSLQKKEGISREEAFMRVEELLRVGEEFSTADSGEMNLDRDRN